jgi:hypothetical protein
METKVLTQEEITQLKDLQDKRKNLSEQFGLLEISYETQKQSLLYQLNQLLQEEDKIGTQLQEKYGDGTINLDKGEFTSN